MNFASERKGSALLIVLGMLAFMVVSAVAFSAYMRASRLPSSYLRRTAAARQLAKAALAEAIERLDVAIGENAYPDQRIDPTGSNRPSSTRMSRLGEKGTDYKNYWFHKIFIGDDTFLSPNDTVSTLTLEGLAYIPPPLVNEARRYSRMSHAATWHSLSFDAGRYAYCAIDVSDCFDINRMVADGRRNSATRRVTLAHLFENKKHDGYEGSGPSKWEDFMKNFRESRTESEEASSGGRIVDNKVPLVSMADWNLAMGEESIAGRTSPFCSEYIGGSGSAFYGNIGNLSGDKANAMRSMPFVTDSYFPGRELESDEADISIAGKKGGQPFAQIGNAKVSLSDIMDLVDSEQATRGLKVLYKQIPLVSLVGLYDYLDYDNTPVTLGLPTIERVPMICGIKPNVSLAVSLKEPEKVGDDMKVVDGYIDRKLAYKINTDSLLGNVNGLEALLMFPFKRGMSEEVSVDASIRLFFAPAGLGLRNVPGVKPVPSENSDDFMAGGFKDGVFKLYAKSSTVKFGGAATQNDAMKSVAVVVDSKSKKSVEDYLKETPAFTVTMRYEIVNAKTGAIDENSGVPVAAECNICPLDANGKVDGNYTDPAKFLPMLQDGSAGSFNLYMAPYVRVLLDSKTVDMAPAHAVDDLYIGINNASQGVKDGVARLFYGPDAPIMRFSATGNPILFTPDGFNSSGGDRTVNPVALMCPDPRYNHAPENWVEATGVDKSDWLDRFGEEGDDNGSAGNRDGDIFMFVSNQGYLQSIYELAFLPRISKEWGKNTDLTKGRYNVPTGNSTEYPKTVSECCNGNIMWRTYRCFENGDNESDKVEARNPFESIGLVKNDGSIKVNPCSQSLDNIMAAFANTPYDWWAASTNNVDISESDINSAKKFNEKYAFNEMNDDAMFPWEGLEEVATTFMDKVRDEKGDWEAAFDDLEWDTGNKSTRAAEFCNVNLSEYGIDPLHNVDRKFLYGFWRDSFANRQQLFLVFVRAEPMMMGGGSASQTPPQLGARAVALVWRDPRMEEDALRTTDKAKTVPHRTRVLFYRQFE